MADLINNTYSEFITRYETAAIDQVFAEESLTAWLENNKTGVQLDFQEVGYVKVASFLIDGLGNYNDADTIVSGIYDDHTGTHSTGYGWQTGHASVNWTVYELQWVRGKAFNIGRIQDEKSAKIAMANAMTEFTRTQVVPEVDACRLSELAGKASASLGNLISETAASLSGNMVTKILNAEMQLKEFGIAKADAMLLLSTTAYNALRTDSKFVNYITQEDQVRGDRTFKVTKFDEMEIIVVPSNRFYTDCVLDSYNGYHPGSTSKLINYMLVDKRVGTAIKKFEKSKVYDSDQTFIGFDGWKLTYTLYHGLIVPKNKIPGLVVSVSTTNDAGTKANKLFVKEVAGTASNTYIVQEFFTNPAGLRGTVYVKAYNTNNQAQTGVTLGGAISSATGAAKVTLGGTITDSTNAYAVFMLVDDNDKIIAISDQVTLVKGA